MIVFFKKLSNSKLTTSVLLEHSPNLSRIQHGKGLRDQKFCTTHFFSFKSFEFLFFSQLRGILFALALSSSYEFSVISDNMKFFPFQDGDVWSAFLWPFESWNSNKRTETLWGDGCFVEGHPVLVRVTWFPEENTFTLSQRVKEPCAIWDTLWCFLKTYRLKYLRDPKRAAQLHI